jgi:S-adenosylmethionine decarboxylase
VRPIKKELSMKGRHAIIEAYGSLSLLESEPLMNLMVKAALAAGSTVLEKNIHSFGKGCGYTATVVLKESHLSVHQWPEINYAAFDIFMCGDVDIHKAIDVLVEAKGEGELFIKLLQRGEAYAQAKNKTVPSLIVEELIEDNEQLVLKVQKALDVGRDVAIRGLVETVKYLYICASSKRSVTPSIKVGMVWHEIILFTRSYEKLCQSQFGRLIHHEPLPDAEENEHQHTKIEELYRQRYGIPDPYFWGDNKVSCGPCEAV